MQISKILRNLIEKEIYEKSNPIIWLAIKEIIPNGNRYKRRVRKTLNASNRLSQRFID